MSGVKIALEGVQIPEQDGQVLNYVHPEAAAAQNYFDPLRRILFVNGMRNSGRAHAESALALSLVQMAPVIGLYNRSGGVGVDLRQCWQDKLLFHGLPGLRTGQQLVKAKQRPVAERLMEARRVLARNAASLALFEELRKPANRRTEIFAHSQGNLIVSNALQALELVDGAAAVSGRVVHSFGSPAANWPKGWNRRCSSSVCS